MSIFEYNKEEEMKKYRRAEREGAREEGMEVGKEIGKEIGIEQERKSKILRLLTKQGSISEELRSQIEKESDLQVLERWFDYDIEAESIEEFQVKCLVRND